jgi:hypothetical protein
MSINSMLRIVSMLCAYLFGLAFRAVELLKTPGRGNSCNSGGIFAIQRYPCHSIDRSRFPVGFGAGAEHHDVMLLGLTSGGYRLTFEALRFTPNSQHRVELWLNVEATSDDYSQGQYPNV